MIFSEKLPRLDHFRLSKRMFTRPSIGELYGDQSQRTVSFLRFRKFIYCGLELFLTYLVLHSNIEMYSTEAYELCI